MSKGYRRRPEYQRLLNSKRWRDLRRWYLQQHPLCERCIEEGEAAGIKGGYIRSAIDVHHVVPVESAKTLQEMENLTFNPHNLRALCIECHQKTHREMGKNTKENVTARRNEAFERWKNKLSKSNGDPSTAQPDDTKSATTEE